MSDELVRRFLNAHPSAVVRSGNPFSPSNFLTEFTRATGDLERSIALLNSLDRDEKVGVALGQIMKGTTGYTFEEKAGLLAESLTTQEELVEGIVEISKQPEFDPFSQPIHPEAIQWIETQEDGVVPEGWQPGRRSIGCWLAR